MLALFIGSLPSLLFFQDPPAVESSRPEDEIAFEVILEGSEAPTLAFTVKEWDDYTGFYRGLHGIDDEAVFINRMLADILQTLGLRLNFYKELSDVEARAAEILRKLENGQSFDRMVRTYSENMQSRQFGGSMGRIAPAMLYYPVNHLLFVTEEGSWTPAMHTPHGIEICYVDKRGGDPHSLDQWVESRSILLVFMPQQNLNAQRRSEIFRKIRLRPHSDRFRRILPPALQDPPPHEFGPEETAPVGNPGVPLKQKSDLDSRNDKVIVNGKVVDG